MIPPSSSAARFAFVDLLRGLAVVVMIETHVVNALLSGATKGEASFHYLSFINGLVAPAFLFCAGFAFAISFHRRWQEYTGMRPQLVVYLRRLLFILIIAYSLHLPLFSLHGLLTLERDGAWMYFFQSDILHVIALTLFFLTALALLARRERLFYGAAFAVALFIIFATPGVRTADWSAAPMWLRPFLSSEFQSLFPLFPWAAFILSGALLGYFFVRSRERGAEQQYILSLTLGAGLAIALSFLAHTLPLTRPEDFWRTSPQFFFIRLGIVVLLLCGFWFVESYLSSRARAAAGTKNRALSSLQLFGQESLLIYVAHLLMVYSRRHPYSFIRLFGENLEYAECAALFAALSLAMYVLAALWRWLKARRYPFSRLVQFALLSSSVIAFILN